MEAIPMEEKTLYYSDGSDAQERRDTRLSSLNTQVRRGMDMVMQRSTDSTASAVILAIPMEEKKKGYKEKEGL